MRAYGHATVHICSRKYAKSKNTIPVVTATIKKGDHCSSGDRVIQCSSVAVLTKYERKTFASTKATSTNSSFFAKRRSSPPVLSSRSWFSRPPSNKRSMGHILNSMQLVCEHVQPLQARPTSVVVQ